MKKIKHIDINLSKIINQNEKIINQNENKVVLLLLVENIKDIQEKFYKKIKKLHTELDK